MCGIFGYIGKRKKLATLISGLKSLEYRGYDSAGIAFFTYLYKIIMAPKTKLMVIL